MPTYQVYMPDKVYKEVNDIADELGIPIKDLMQMMIGNFITAYRESPGEVKKGA